MGAKGTGRPQRPDLDAAFAAYRAGGGEEELRAVVEAGEALVRHFARFYAGGRPAEDLVQAGYEGLIKAVRRFDPGRNVRFATFAAHCVMGEIRHQLRREARFSRSGWVTDLQARVHQAAEDIVRRTGEPPRLEDVAAAVNVREEGVLQIMRAGLVHMDEVDLSRIKHRRYESFQLPVEDRVAVRLALGRLSELQRKVVYLVFWCDLTQTQAAKELGISQRRACRLLHRGLARMAENLA